MERVVEIITDGRAMQIPLRVVDEIRKVAADATMGLGHRDLIVNKYLDADGRTHYTVDIDER